MNSILDFYTSPLSPFAQKVHFFLEETGKPYNYKSLNLMKAEQQSAMYEAINDFKQVPAIQLGDTCLAESGAILRYLAAKWELHDWYPINLEERAQVDRFMEFTSLHINRPLLDLAWNLAYGPKLTGIPCNQGVVEDAQQRLLKHLPKLEKHLKVRNYIAGPRITIADANLLPFAAMHAYAQVPLRDFPAFEAWLGRMTSRPSWKKVAAKLAELKLA